jgi:hypothetical protein
MYKLRTKGGKRNPIINWALPERVFFACGACPILAYAFIKAYPDSGFNPVWIRPAKGYTGNHILVVRGQLAYDYHGYSHWPTLLAHMKRKANRWWPGWDADLIRLPEEVNASNLLTECSRSSRIPTFVNNRIVEPPSHARVCHLREKSCPGYRLLIQVS